MKNASLTYKSSSVSNGWPMLSHRGRCHTNWYQDQRSYVWYLKKPYTRYKWYKLQVVSFQQSSDVHKKCKIQASTIYPKYIPLHQWEAHLLWKLMTKGERLYKDMKASIGGRDKLCKGRDKIWKLRRLDMNMDKEGATLEKRDGSKFLDKRSTQVGGASSWTLIDCIWYVHIHVLACIA